MLLLSVVLSLAAGWLAGGRLGRFEGAGLKLLPLPALSLLVQRLSAAPWALCLAYGLLFLFLWRNRHLKKTALLMGAGSLLNLLVIALNGWRMPVSARATALLSPQGLAALTAGDIPMYALADAGTLLPFLGDILYLPLPLIGGFASVGDLLLAAGLFFCLMAVMDPPRLPRRIRAG